jgi:hypothetical protein
MSTLSPPPSEKRDTKKETWSVSRLLHSGHIHVALALGASIIVLALVSKRVLPEPMDPLYLSITSLIMLGYETVVGTKKYRRLERSVYWVLAIVLATTLIILLHIL